MVTLSILRLREVWGLHAHDYQVVNFFHLVGLASVKELRKCASDTVIWVLPRGARAEDMGEGSVLGRTHRVLLRYNSQQDTEVGFSRKGKTEPGWDNLCHILNSCETGKIAQHDCHETVKSQSSS